MTARAIKDLAGVQMKLVKPVAHLVHAFVTKGEPDSACDSEAFATCLATKHSGWDLGHDFRSSFRSHCARISECKFDPYGIPPRYPRGEKGWDANHGESNWEMRRSLNKERRFAEY